MSGPDPDGGTIGVNTSGLTRRGLAYIWQVSTLSWVPWDGSLTTGAITIGTVNQGSAGSDPWKVTGNVTATVNTISNFAQETGGNLATLATNLPPQGQALAAASLPVILPAATISTLTPPAAITNFANETGGNLATVNTNTAPLVVSNAGAYVRQDSTATIAKESGGNLATIAADIAPLVTAQGTAASGVVGPLVQSLVGINQPTYSNAIVAPISLTPNGQVRTLSDTEESASVWDEQWFDDPWNQHPSAMNFDTTNQLTVDNVWES